MRRRQIFAQRYPSAAPVPSGASKEPAAASHPSSPVSRAEEEAGQVIWQTPVIEEDEMIKGLNEVQIEEVKLVVPDGIPGLTTEKKRGRPKGSKNRKK